MRGLASYELVNGRETITLLVKSADRASGGAIDSCIKVKLLPVSYTYGLNFHQGAH